MTRPEDYDEDEDGFEDLDENEQDIEINVKFGKTPRKHTTVCRALWIS
jgi:hypothetical protein